MVSDMYMYLKSTVAAAALMSAALLSPALAQTASEMAVRMSQLEEQVRTLMGEVEQLNFEVKQLRAQSGKAKTGRLEAVPQLPQQQPAKLARAAILPEASAAPEALAGGVEEIEAAPLDQPVLVAPSDEAAAGLQKAPAAQVLGALDNAAAKPDDGGFQGKVLVAPGQQDPGDDAFIAQQPAQVPAADEDSIETVSLSPDNPETLYETSNENLLRRQFSDAEAGFRNFLQKYPEHGLAGSAQYWLGETYYAQSDFRQAAQAFLQGYKKYPKSRRAADSLLKLGISLNRLGQTQQACGAYAAVSSEYPKAVEARKRAQAEAKRAGCQA